MEFDSHIYSISAREILDSRGIPTIETMMILTSGFRATVSVPAGTSVGSYEAHELRDADPNRYRGLGVLKAVHNVNTLIGPKLKGFDAGDQSGLDDLMRNIDGTPNKGSLGANAILSVSLAAASAMSSLKRVPLYPYLNTLFTPYATTKVETIPTPLIEMINGGKHGAGNLDFQEFHLIPASHTPFHVGLERAVTIYQILGDLLIHRNVNHSVGLEGGYAPNLYTNAEAIALILEALRGTNLRLGVDMFLGLDLAANSFKKEKGYVIKDKPTPLSPKELIDFLMELNEKSHFLILEDPLIEDDWESWQLLTQKIGQQVLVVGDDLLVTNTTRLETAIAKKACSAILLKPNQIGSLSEFFAVTALAKKNNFKTIVSHRSGETNETFIADLAVAVQSDYVKFGAPTRGERVAKYNRLLQIESELRPRS